MCRKEQEGCASPLAPGEQSAESREKSGIPHIMPRPFPPQSPVKSLDSLCALTPPSVLTSPDYRTGADTARVFLSPRRGRAALPAASSAAAEEGLQPAEAQEEQKLGALRGEKRVNLWQARGVGPAGSLGRSAGPSPALRDGLRLLGAGAVPQRLGAAGLLAAAARGDPGCSRCSRRPCRAPQDPEAWTRAWRGRHPARSRGGTAGRAELGRAREVREFGTVPGAEACGKYVSAPFVRKPRRRG